MIVKYSTADNNYTLLRRTASFADYLHKICQLSCAILIIYYCWYVQAFGNQALIVYGAFLIVSVCLFLIHFLYVDIRINSIPYGIWNFLVIVVYAFITGIFVSYDFGTLLHAIRQYIIYFVIIYAFCVVSNYADSYEWILKSINIGILISCAQLLFFGYNYSASRIVLSNNSNPNLLGTLLNLGLFSVLFRIKYTLKSVLISAFEIGIIFYNVIMTGSRKSFIGSIILISFWCVALIIQSFKEENTNKRILLILVLLFIIIAFSGFYRKFIVHSTVIARMGTMRNEESNSERIKMYREAVKVFIDKPIFGGGFDQFRYWSGRGGYAHSTYAEAIADFGTLGAVIYFTPFICAAIQSVLVAINKKGDYHSVLILALCIVELFLGTVQTWFFEMAHVFSWAIIFIFIQWNYRDNKIKRSYSNLLSKHKYIR